MHYYKRNLGDYAKKAGKLSMLQHGSYTLLIDACYDREQFPTLEEAIDWTWASTTEEVEAVTFVLRKFFTLENGVYVQNRIQQDIAEYHEKADKNQQIAIDRETKRRENNTNRAPDVHEAPPNHKPITNNHKPIVKEKVSGKLKPTIKNWHQILEGLNVNSNHARDWLKVRGKNELTETALRAMEREAAKAGIGLDRAVQICAEKGWRGFNSTWKWQDDVSEKSNYEPPYAKYMREQVEKMSPSIAAPNPNNPQPKRIDPNEFLRTIEAQNVVRIN